MSKASSEMMKLRGVLLFIVLVSPIAGQFTLPVLYMPLRRVFPTFGSDPKHQKVTTEHIRILSGWSLEKAYSGTFIFIFNQLGNIGFYNFIFTDADLQDLNYQWSYEIPFDDINGSFVDQRNVLTPADYQKELLKFTGEKFHFTVNNVASRLGIPAINLSHSYDPGDWETVVHAMIKESSLAFIKMLQLPSLDSFAQLVQTETQDLLNVNLSTFESLVFPFPSIKDILDTNTTSMIFNSSGVTEDSYGDSTLTRVLTNAEINLSPQQFAILYNKSDEQAKTIDRTTLNQIYHMCDISVESVLDMTLPEASGKVVGSVNQSPPCPVLINIKGKPISSFQSDSVVITEDMTVMEIVFAVSSLPWRTVHWALDAPLSEWEYLDAVTLPQLAEITGDEVESLRNESVSESARKIYSLKENITLDSRVETFRVFIKGVLKESFNFSLNEVAILNEVHGGSLQNYSSTVLFRSFVNATVIHFKLNLSEIITAVQMTEEQLFSLPRQEWNNTISHIIDAAVILEAAKLQLTTQKLLQLLDVTFDELSITQLKKLIRTDVQDLRLKKMKFENDPISWSLANNSISDADYLNSSVLTLLLSASGFNSEELELVYDLNSDQIFNLGEMRVSDLPRICGLDTSATKDRTAHNITEELTGIKESRAVCANTRFYVEARHRNMSFLRSAFSILANSSISFVNLVEMVTDLPWRQNIWAFGLKMEDWTVLYVLNQETFEEVTGITVDTFLSRTLLQILESSIQLQNESNQALLDKVKQSRDPTLNILYEVFNTDEDELIQFSGITKAKYDELPAINVIPYVFQYLVAKYNVSLKPLEAALNLKPGNLPKLSPTEWTELIPFVKAEYIRSGKQQLGVTLPNFAMLLHETIDSLQTLTLAQIELKWDNVFTRLLKGKSAMEKESILEIINYIGITVESLQDVIVLEFIENRINLSKSDLLLLYNFSSVGIEVLANYTFMELPVYCELRKDDIFDEVPHTITVSMLGHNDDMACRKIALVVAAATKTVDELATKFNFEVKNNISTLTMFQALFQLPWPKIAWAVNVSLSDWPVLGAISLNDIADLTSESANSIRLVRSFREVTRELLALPSNFYANFLNDYRSELLKEASSLFNVNASLISDGCNILDILWNSLIQLNAQIDYDPSRLPKELNVNPYEFNLTLPSRWSLLVLPIVRDAYSKAARVLGMDPDRLSTLLNVPAEVVRNLSLQNFKDLLEQSIRPFIDAKTSLMISSLLDLATAKGTNLTVLLNESIFDVIDLLVSVPIQNISFIFNWTAMERARLRNYTLADILYYKEVGLRGLADGKLLSLANFILEETLLPHTTSTPTLAPCKGGLTKVSSDVECTVAESIISARATIDESCDERLDVEKRFPSLACERVRHLGCLSAQAVASRCGSVIVDFEMKFIQNVVVSEVLNVLKTAAEEDNFDGFKVDPNSIEQVSPPPTDTSGTEADKECKCSCNDVILAAVVGVLVFVIIGLILYIVWLHKKGTAGRQRHYKEERDVYDNEMALDDLQPSSHIPSKSIQSRSEYMDITEATRHNEETQRVAHSTDYAPLHPSTRSWEVEKQHVTIEKVIGKGAFGQVAKGTATGLLGRPGKTTVAVKMLKYNSPESDRRDLLTELHTMKQLKPHPHVIKLLGCVTETEPLMVIIEYVPCGDLLGYLRKSRGLNDTYYKDPDIKPQTSLTSQQLMKFAWQIADGMSYLSSKSIIHRDLAARNVLVGERETCKVTDFGMARDVQQDNIYKKKTKGRLPVKWTAYEALLYGTYTTKSDIWSYGVVLYEIFTIGGSPYPRVNGKRIASLLQEGYRMPKPQHVDDKLYEIMLKCWQNDPDVRPTFSELKNQLKDMENQHKRLINLKMYDHSQLYANVEDLVE